jgi:hypothetical protein
VLSLNIWACINVKKIFEHDLLSGICRYLPRIMQPIEWCTVNSESRCWNSLLRWEMPLQMMQEQRMSSNCTRTEYLIKNLRCRHTSSVELEARYKLDSLSRIRVLFY